MSPLVFRPFFVLTRISTVRIGTTLQITSASTLTIRTQQCADQSLCVCLSMTMALTLTWHLISRETQSLIPTTPLCLRLLRSGLSTPSVSCFPACICLLMRLIASIRSSCLLTLTATPIFSPQQLCCGITPFVWLTSLFCLATRSMVSLTCTLTF